MVFSAYTLLYGTDIIMGLFSNYGDLVIIAGGGLASLDIRREAGYR